MDSVDWSSVSTVQRWRGDHLVNVVYTTDHYPGGAVVQTAVTQLMFADHSYDRQGHSVSATSLGTCVDQWA